MDHDLDEDRDSPGRPHARLSRSGRSARAARHPQSWRTRAAGSRRGCSRARQRSTGCDSSASTGPASDSPAPRRAAATPAGPTTSTTIADALGYREFGVTGWSEGGPWALAAAAYIDPLRLRHVSSIAGGSYGTFGDNWAADHLSKADALGGFLALHFEPGFRLMYATLGITAEHFRADLRQAIAESRQRLRSTDSASTRISKPPSAKPAPNASPKAATGWFATASCSIGAGPST